MTSYSTHENTEDFSDINDDEINDITSEAKENNLTYEFREKVKRFLFIDDTIRTKREEIKELQRLRKPCEDFILGYLENQEEKIINTPTAGKLIKNESTTKARLKMDIIKEAILEKTKNEKIFDTEEKYNRFLDSILDLMDKKRPMQKRVNLKRIMPRQKKVNTKISQLSDKKK